VSEPTPEDICRDDCTSGCHATDCEHHGHPAAITGSQLERLTAAICRTQMACDGTCPDHVNGSTAIHGYFARAILKELT